MLSENDIKGLNNLLENDTLSQNKECLSNLTSILFRIVQALHDQNEILKYHLTELEGKFFRFGLANHSILNLSVGNSFDLIGSQTQIVDTFSLKCLARMQIESYMLMYYLFFDKISDEEKSFRYNVYKLHGLQKQIGFNIETNDPLIEEQKSKIKNEINDLKNMIKQSHIYRSSNKKNKDKLLKPVYPKLIDSKKLFVTSNLSKLNLNIIWQLYSNHAHSEHISDRQYNSSYRDYKNGNQFRVDDCNMLFKICNILTSLLIYYLNITFESAKSEYIKLPISYRLSINFYSKLTDD